MKIGIIVQARVSSTRLPQKVLLPFHEGVSIAEIILSRLKSNKYNFPVVLATSLDNENNPLEALANKLKVETIRGSESHVLSRFIAACENYKFTHVVRVCCDNPFLDLEKLEDLISYGIKEPNVDYISFSLDGKKPTILSHIGTFAEWVSAEALIRTMKESKDEIYHEHVTNYIYTHPKKFRIKLIPTNSELSNRTDIRLTCDTKNDFKYLQKIFSDIYDGGNISISSIMRYLEQNPNWLEKMKKEIQANEK